VHLPIFGFCDGWLSLYPDKESAEIDIEPIDVENNEWIVFDSAGNKMKLLVKTHTSKIPFLSKEITEIVESNTSDSEARDEFKRLLIASIKTLSDKEKSRRGFPVSDELLSTTPLEQLLLLAQKAFQQH